MGEFSSILLFVGFLLSSSDLTWFGSELIWPVSELVIAVVRGPGPSLDLVGMVEFPGCRCRSLFTESLGRTIKFVHCRLSIFFHVRICW